ncbi:MAG: AAA family ATPase [Salinarchaeum sp.]
MTVVATVGLPGSGKGEAAVVAEELGVPVVTMGDVIREECRERGLDPAIHHGQVAKDLRAEHGPDAIAERSLPLIKAALENHETVLVDGVRSDIEVERFEAAFEDFLLVSIEAPRDVRRERLASRDGSGSAETLEERDERELGFGMGAAMDRADIHIENDDSLEAYRRRIREILTERAEVA